MTLDNFFNKNPRKYWEEELARRKAAEQNINIEQTKKRRQELRKPSEFSIEEVHDKWNEPHFYRIKGVPLDGKLNTVDIKKDRSNISETFEHWEREFSKINTKTSGRFV